MQNEAGRNSAPIWAAGLLGNDPPIIRSLSQGEVMKRVIIIENRESLGVHKQREEEGEREGMGEDCTALEPCRHSPTTMYFFVLAALLVLTPQRKPF